MDTFTGEFDICTKCRTPTPPKFLSKNNVCLFCLNDTEHTDNNVSHQADKYYDILDDE